MTGLDLFLVLAVTFRLTWLITQDTITEGLRARVEHSAGSPSGWLPGPVAYLVTCVACLSMWIGPAVVAAALWLPGLWWRLPALAVTASAVTLLIGECIAYLGARSER